MSGMSPSQARFKLPHAQHSQLHAQHLQQQQQPPQQQPQQPQQQQLMLGGLPAGVVALGPQQMSYQPLHASPGHAVSPARLSPKGPSLHQQPTQHQQQPQQQQQQQPKQLPVRAMPLGRASQQGRSRVAIPVVKPDHVDGMTREDIIVAAAAAAAASGYGEPEGLASLVGTRVKVSKNEG